jgi:hypothetical protein
MLVTLIVGGCLHTMQPLNPSELLLSSQAALRLKAHVQFLANPDLAGREPGTIGNQKAADYIEAAFREGRLHSFPSMSGFRQSISSRLGDNVLGFTPSSGESARWILIGAHYDHLGGHYLGADDNASSIAIVIELAERLRSLSNYSVIFAAFNTEEHPYFGTPMMGSEYFLQHLPPEIGSQNSFQAVVIMDLMGGVQWAPIEHTIFAAGAEKSPALYGRVKETVASQRSFVNREDEHMMPDALRLTILPVGIHLVEEIPDRGHNPVSDYDGFRNRGVPFLLLSSARTPRYHTPNDQADTLHYERMASTVTWLDTLLQSIDTDVHPYDFDGERIEFGDEVAAFRTIIGHAIDERTVIPGTSRWSLHKLKEDAEWLKAIDGTSPTRKDRERMERVSIRFQCLLADYSGCFLF